MALKGTFDFGRDCINRLPLRATIRMIDAVFLIMPVQESSPDKIRYYPADIAPA